MTQPKKQVTPRRALVIWAAANHHHVETGKDGRIWLVRAARFSREPIYVLFAESLDQALFRAGIDMNDPSTFRRIQREPPWI